MQVAFVKLKYFAVKEADYNHSSVQFDATIYHCSKKKAQSTRY